MFGVDFLKNTNVFVFDTETTGLPAKSPNGWGSFWDYKLNDKYDKSRIVSIAWSSISNYGMSNESQLNNTQDTQTQDKHLTTKYNIEHYLRYPEDFIDIPTTHIHGISFQDILTKGIKFGLILINYGLGKALLDANYLVAHNISFDYHVLMNELYRLTLICSLSSDITNIQILNMANSCISHLQYLKQNACVICTGELSTPICKLPFPSTNAYLGYKKNYKMPKLQELYKFCFGKEFENAHSADGDVKALLEILSF